MELIRGLHNLKPHHRHNVVTIGNFDGVHLGHQALLKKLVTKAQQLTLPALVITFEPQPNEYFTHGKTPPRLMRLREKLQALKDCGVDRVLCLRFNQFLADMSAEQFIEKVLIEGLGARYIIIGDDFRFGHLRRGDAAMLQNYAKENDFTLERMTTFEMSGERISSTRVRKALEAGNLKLAEQLLGRPFMLSGHVAHGNKRGRILGFPTANIYLHRRAVPIMGVYVVRMHGVEAEPIEGVANVGNRPTVTNSTRSLLEVHLFNFDRNIYGQHVNVEFLQKLRDEEKYASFELLKQQIFKDAEKAKEYFRKHCEL